MERTTLGVEKFAFKINSNGHSSWVSDLTIHFDDVAFCTVLPGNGKLFKGFVLRNCSSRQ